MHLSIRFKSLLYVASYIANNTENASSINMTMSNICLQAYEQCAVRGDNRTRVADNRHSSAQYNGKYEKLADKPHFVDFCVFDIQFAPPEKQVTAAAVEE